MTQSYKNKIDEFFTNRYDYLNECAYNCLKIINKTHLKSELVSELYEHLTQNESKLSKLIMDNQIEAIAVRWMKMQIVWSKTKFKNAWTNPGKQFLDVQFDKRDEYDEKMGKFKQLDDVDELIDDGTNKKSLLVKTHIYNYVHSETLDQRILFETVFQNGYNTSGKLAKYTGISRTGCYFLIKKLKDNIKDTYKK